MMGPDEIDSSQLDDSNWDPNKVSSPIELVADMRIRFHPTTVEEDSFPILGSASQ